MPTSKSSIDHRDVYYRKGKAAGYRARSAYKLLHLDEEFDLFSGVETAVDLCAAPGSWSQVLGQKLKPSKGDGEGKKVVSIDLQPMAPLSNITILQTDITLPSTIPLVLDALGGRKANLVVCDGAPDVTGVHDLDAYLHSQLLLAALTLSLTLLAPHSTLIFKIFLSPLDPKAALLCSQLRSFFPGPSDSNGTDYDEFEERDEEQHEDDMDVDGRPELGGSGQGGKDGFDLCGRRGGVWVRKPRSSRKGSGEAFVVCRNFDPAKVPLPTTFSESALAELRRQTSGTLTLDSLSSLGLGEGSTSREWEMIKGYVGGGDLNPMAVKGQNERETPLRPQAVPIKLQLPTSPLGRFEHLSTSPTALFAQPTPVDEPPEYFTPSHTPPQTPAINTTFLSPTKITTSGSPRLAGPAQRAAALALAGSEGGSSPRQSSLESLTSNPSPISLVDPTRPWSASAHATTSAPSPYLAPQSSLSVPSRFRSHSSASTTSEKHIALNTPLVSPTLSSSSKTDLFFASSQIDVLPAPPRPLPNATALGRGLPSDVKKGDDRSVSMPSRQPPLSRADKDQVPNSWQDPGSIDLTSPAPSSLGWPGIPEPRAGVESFKFGFEEISTSRLRSMSNPAPPHAASSSTSSLHSPATSRFLRTNVDEPLATLPSLPDSVNALTSGSPLKRPIPQRPNHGRRESQQLERELREAGEDISIHSGDVISPEDGAEGTTKKRGWKLIRKLGEGAFSAVWSAHPSSSSDVETGKVAALKLMDRHLSLVDSRTRISFLREVEVLRHISHPSIVSYLDSFTTPTHHVLVLEELGGGELFDLMSVEENRRRMLLPSPPSKVDGDGEVEDRDGEGFVRRVFGELTRAVGWLHEVGVVHRDIKLENILFTTNPFLLPPTSTSSIPLHLLPLPPKPLIKLTDFGLSRFISPSAPLLQTRCGSESFAAPEIIMGKKYDGRETDAWAMGVVLYGLIVGELPFDREEEYPSSSAGGGGGASRPNTPAGAGGGEIEGRWRGRKRMMRIAKGEYSWPRREIDNNKTESGTESGLVGSTAVRSLVGKLLVRDPKKRIRVNEIWDQEWIALGPNAPGGLERPSSHVNTIMGGQHVGLQSRRVLDGFLVEEDGIEEVARVEL
ncbi:hypothetical protein CI109_107017 [Kwoniella shandongensis]|uniref:Uncharacterized protein n=1 Tax=Kwoniella shandongensis TaxID=1734106 RepID=A0A5M6BNQ7_9TREE|nr:uncharacterized protein CI109_007326 [Kwoniella shandongensis]KAA5524343.1 hypothetical protein CI109_007326 [Kwoniella shandongensis]